jgi:hypothetical protein
MRGMLLIIGIMFYLLVAVSVSLAFGLLLGILGFIYAIGVNILLFFGMQRIEQMIMDNNDNEMDEFDFETLGETFCADCGEEVSIDEAGNCPNCGKFILDQLDEEIN